MTSLADGQRVSKCCERLEAYGTIDELNSHLGVLLTYCDDEGDISVLTGIQRMLFVIGGRLAGAEGREEITTDAIEGEIDRLTSIVEEAQEDKRFHFILPGGCRAAAYAHVCRTVCRRAERAMLRVEDVKGDETRYVNRLSDYLFILARKLNVDNNTKDIIV